MTRVNETAELPAAGLPPPETGAPVAAGPDEELVALPAPPRRGRLLAMTLMAGVVVVAAGLALQLRADIAYFFASAEAQDLGPVTAVQLAELTPNRYVRIEGTPMLSNAVEFERGVSRMQYVLFPLAGQRQIFVQVGLADFKQPSQGPRAEYAGRLVSFGQVGGRLGAVRSYLAEQMGLPVTAESFVLLSGESPGAYAWAPALAVACLLMVLLNVWLLLRWFRPLGQ